VISKQDLGLTVIEAFAAGALLMRAGTEGNTLHIVLSWIAAAVMMFVFLRQFILVTRRGESGHR
jgi:hypothetical protein